MQKAILILPILLLHFFCSAQWNIDAPSLNETQSKLLNNKALIAEIEKEMGLSFDQLEFKSDGWSGYQKSGFTLSYGQCGEAFYPTWPQDACFTKFIINGPKDKDGVYKSMGVYADYKRSSYNGESCQLNNTWSYAGYRIESAQEYGYKEFSVSEAKSLLMDYLKGEEAHVLDNFIEITAIDFENFGQSSTSAGIHHLSFFFKGTEVQFTDDRSAIIGMEDASSLKMSLQVEKVDGQWKGSRLGLFTGAFYPYDQSYNPKSTEKVYDEFYADYKSDGIDAIYPKRTEKAKKSGELDELSARIEGYLNLLKTKGLELTKSDLLTYISPSAQQEADTWLTANLTEATKLRVLVDFELEEVLPFKYVKDGTAMKIAFPEISAKFVRYTKPKKKWLEQTQCSDCNGGSSSSPKTTNHKMVWIWEDNQWYLYNAQSFFMENELKFDLSE